MMEKTQKPRPPKRTNKFRLCDLPGMCEDCTKCPFGVIDADADCPKFYDAQDAVSDLNHVIATAAAAVRVLSSAEPEK